MGGCIGVHKMHHVGQGENGGAIQVGEEMRWGVQEGIGWEGCARGH